jgi:acyl carrier protein
MPIPYVAPRNDDERILADLWAEGLRVERVGIVDNFFDLGGDSMVMTLILGRIQETFGVSLTIRAMFDDPTVQALAERIAELRTSTEHAQALMGAAAAERATVEGAI